MTIALVGSAQGTGTTASLNTSGASLLAVYVAYDSVGATLSDSKGNSWTGLTANNTAGGSRGRWWYCASPSSVGASHTFSSSVSYAAVFVVALSGTKTTSPIDVESTAVAAAVATLASGTVTPSEDGCIVLAGIAIGGSSTSPAFASPLTNAQQKNAVTGTNYGGAIAYEIQTTATARNPSATWTTVSDGIANAVVVKAASGPVLSGGITLDALVAAGTLDSTPSSLTGAITLDAVAAAGSLGLAPGIITSSVFKNWSGAVLASVTIPKVAVIKVSDMSLVYSTTNVSTDASGIMTITNVALVSGVQYLLVTCNTDGTAFGCAPFTAS